MEFTQCSSDPEAREGLGTQACLWKPAQAAEVSQLWDEEPLVQQTSTGHRDVPGSEESRGHKGTRCRRGSRALTHSGQCGDTGIPALGDHVEGEGRGGRQGRLPGGDDAQFKSERINELVMLGVKKARHVDCQLSVNT